jgi:DNA-binding response OmpR family regulator
MRILVIDDDATVLDGVRTALQLHWHDVTVLTATDGEAGLRQFFEHDPDAVLLEITLPDLSGFDVLRQVRRVSDAPVVVLSARHEDADQIRALELGADEFVVKPCSYLVLVARIKAILRRAELLPPERALPDLIVGELVFNFRDRRVTLRDAPVKLTPVEYRLLYHLVRNAGRLMPHEALLDRVWGAEYGHSPEHLKVFISRLRAKIERPGGPHLIETVRGIGYMFVHTDPWRAGQQSARAAPALPVEPLPARPSDPRADQAEATFPGPPRRLTDILSHSPWWRER